MPSPSPTPLHAAAERVVAPAPAAEGLLDAFFETAAVGLFVATPTGAFVRANAAFAALVGVPPAALVGRSVEELTHPDDRAETRRVLREVATHRLPHVDLEKRYLRDDGTPVWTHVTVAAAYGADGAASRLLVTVRDLTAHKDLAKQLRDASTRYRRLVDANIIGVAVADEGGVREANDEYLRVAGTTREAFEAHGLDWRAITPPEHLPLDLRGMKEILERGACTPFEKEYVWPDGTRVPLLVAAALLEREPLRWIAFALDLTERKRAEGRVRLLQELTAALGAALTTDEIAEVVVSRVLQALGADGGSLLVRGPDDSCHIVRGMGYGEEADAAWVGRAIPLDEPMPITDAIRGGCVVEVASLAEWRVRYPAHTAVHEGYGFEGIAVFPCLLDGRVLGAVALSFRDQRVLAADERELASALARQCAQALERARLHEAEHAARSAAEEANRAKSEFLSAVSHDLRTPLNAIAGYAQLMQMGIPDPVTPAQEEYLARIQGAQRHLLSLVNNVLNLAKIESGRVDYRHEDVPVGELWGAVEALVAPQIRAKGLGYAVAPCDPALAVRVDREKTVQALLNLVGNAIKFTDAGGVVALDAEALPGGAVALRVRDTGIGIAPEKLATIFEPFVQVDGGRQARTGDTGVGLGLAISRHLARGMNGDLTATSEVGKGSTFTVTLPRAGGE